MGYNFKADNEKGKVAERKFEQIMSKYDDVDIENVTQVKEYQEIDVDYIVHDKITGEDNLVEIKNQTNVCKYGNIVIELISNTEYNTLGWWKKTKCDWFLFYIPQKDIFLKIKRSKLKEYIEFHGFDGKMQLFNSWCGLVNYENFCKYFKKEKGDYVWQN